MEVVPDLDWYLKRSREQGTEPRCPFATVEACPRYFQSLSLLGQAGSTSIEAAEDQRLLTNWRQSDLWPRTAEYETSTQGPTGEPRHFLNYCPEVSFDRFGYFAASLHARGDERDIDAAHVRLSEKGVPATHWKWDWSAVKPMHYAECPLYSPLQNRQGKGRLGPDAPAPRPGTDVKWYQSRAIQAALIGAVATLVIGVLAWTKGGPPAQVAQVEGARDTTIYQAGRDVVVSEPVASSGGLAPAVTINSLVVEARLTASILPASELPPGEVEFVPVGDSHAYLEGPAGRTRLRFQSPVRFRSIDGNRLVVTNRFSLDSDAELLQRPVEALRNFNSLSVPIVTVVWGQALDAMRLLEVSIFMNNEGPYYGSWEYDVPFQTGPRFSIPLAPFTDRIVLETR